MAKMNESPRRTCSKKMAACQDEMQQIGTVTGEIPEPVWFPSANLQHVKGS